MNRGKRIANTERHIARQVRIAKSKGPFWSDGLVPSHRLAKKTWRNCGNPRCMFCQNPRVRGELTMAEKRTLQAMRADLREFAA